MPKYYEFMICGYICISHHTVLLRLCMYMQVTDE